MADTTLAFNDNAVTKTGAGGTALMPTTPTPVGNQPATSSVTSPTVVTSTAATNDLTKIKSTLDDTKAGMQNQAFNLDQIKANMAITDAQNAKAAQDKAVADAKIAADNAKTKALGGVGSTTTTPTTSNTSTPTATPMFNAQGQQIDASGKVIAGGQTYNDAQGSQAGTGNTSTTPGGGSNEANRINAEMYARANQTSQDILNIQNGTIPLTAGEQAQVNDLKNQFQNLITQTQTANTNYQQGLQILGAESGRQRYTPETHLGSMQDAVNKGIQKINDLNLQMSAAVAKLEQGFRDDNINVIKSAYQTYQTAAKDRVDFINKMTADAAAATKDQRDFAYKQSQDLIQNTMKSQEFDYKKTQDAIDNAFKAGQLTETQRHNLADEALKRAAQGGVDGAGIPGLPQVNMTGDNVPNSADQEKFLASLPKDVATLVKGIADYSINLSTSPQKQYKGASGLSQAQMAALVLQYDPTFSQANFATRQAYLKSLSSGTIYQGVVAGNKAINHLISFADTVSKLPNIYPSSGLNKAVQAANYPFSGDLQQNISKANAEANGVKDELAKFFKGTGASDVKSIDDWGKTLDVGANANSLKGTVQGAIDLLAGQLSVVQQGYISTMGKAPTGQILQPATIQKLSNLKNQGYTVDIPGVYYTDKNAFLKYDTDAQGKMDSAYQKLQDAGIPTTPENILQAAQL